MGRIRRWIDFLLGVPLSLVLSLFADQPSSTVSAQKILIIKLAAVGDTILLIPLLRSLRRQLPNATIHWLVSHVNEEIARTAPYVDRFIVSNNFLPSSLWKLIRELRKEKYDAVVDFEQWARGTAFIGFLTKAKIRLGFDTPKQFRSYLLTKAHSKTYKQHEIDEFYDLMSLLVPMQHDKFLEIREPKGGQEELRKMCSIPAQKRAALRVLLHPGCGKGAYPREWPLDRYAELGRWLQDRYHALLFLSGGPDEVEKNHQLEELLDQKCVNLSGKLSWKGMISLVKIIDLLVSGNTGVMHLAAALQKPQIALHGPTNSNLWGPLNPKAKVIKSSCPRCPCLKLGFEYHSQDQSCMEKIGIQEVKTAAAQLLNDFPETRIEYADEMS